MNWTRQGEVHVSEDRPLGWYTIRRKLHNGVLPGYRAMLHREAKDSLIITRWMPDLDACKRDIELFDSSAKPHNVVAKARAFAEGY